MRGGKPETPSMISLCLRVSSLLALLSGAADAAILVQYNFNDASSAPSSVLAPSATTPGVTPGNFTLNGGLTGSNPVTYTPGWVGVPSSNVDLTNGTETTAVTYGDYFSLTITPTVGTTVNLATLTFDTAFYVSTNLPATVTATYFIRSSRDGYANNVGGTFTENHQLAATTPVVFTPRTVDLSAAEFQNLTAPVTFRIYLYDSSNSATRYISIDNVTLNGTLVPEPSTSGILALAAVLPLVRRRR